MIVSVHFQNSTKTFQNSFANYQSLNNNTCIDEVTFIKDSNICNFKDLLVSGGMLPMTMRAMRPGSSIFRIFPGHFESRENGHASSQHVEADKKSVKSFHKFLVK